MTTPTTRNPGAMTYAVSTDTPNRPCRWQVVVASNRLPILTSAIYADPKTCRRAARRFAEVVGLEVVGGNGTATKPAKAKPTAAKLRAAFGSKL